MGLYEGIKDVAKVVQQADNIELYKQLLDLSNQALEMQAEIARLKEENQELRKANKLLHAFLIERKLVIEYLKWKRMMLDE